MDVNAAGGCWLARLTVGNSTPMLLAHLHRQLTQINKFARVLPGGGTRAGGFTPSARGGGNGYHGGAECPGARPTIVFSEE
jgi:hypothetical protein